MKNQKLKELVLFAKKNSPFYKELYKNIDELNFLITDLPLIKQEEFWKANDIANNQLLTNSKEQGITFKSGGTTGNPKFSFFSYPEWQDFTNTFGQGMIKNDLAQDDKIANLFYAGNLYASFLFIHNSILNARSGQIFPIAGHTSCEEIISSLKQFNINVLAGVPTTIMKIVDYIKENKNQDLKINKILFGGESFYSDQREIIKTVFQGCKILSIGCASVDAGEIGFCDQGCEIDEHRVFDDSTILEIIDEDTSEVIKDVGVVGKIYLTNLNRKTMPIIRYPVGDKASWIEPLNTKNRKFKLAGRTNEGARVGPVTLYPSDIEKILHKFVKDLDISTFQIVITHIDAKDKATIKIASSKEKYILDKYTDVIRKEIYSERKMLHDSVVENIIQELQIDWIKQSELVVNERTGKLKRIIDKRYDGIL